MIRRTKLRRDFLRYFISHIPEMKDLNGIQLVLVLILIVQINLNTSECQEKVMCLNTDLLYKKISVNFKIKTVFPRNVEIKT